MPDQPVMPQPIKEVYEPLQQQVQSLHREWLMFRQVYGTSNKRINLISRIAGSFFAVVQRTLYDHCLLSLSRLLDPPDHGKKRHNLTLERLANVVKTDGASIAVLSTTLSQIHALIAPHADVRNKIIAHNDLPTTPTLYDGTSTITGPSRQTFEDCLGLVRDLMNAVRPHYEGTSVEYWSADWPPLGDGETLICHLQFLADQRGWQIEDD